MAATNGSRIEILETAFVSSEEGNLFVQLAHAYRDSGDRLRAFRILRRGIEQHPTYGPAYELLGRVLLDQERMAEAEAVFERLLELEPKNTVAHGALDEIKRRMEPGPATAAVSLGSIPLGGPAAALRQRALRPRRLRQGIRRREPRPAIGAVMATIRCRSRKRRPRRAYPRPRLRQRP